MFMLPNTSKFRFGVLFDNIGYIQMIQSYSI